MLNKELIELQKGCKATCVVIQNEDVDKLDSKIVIPSNIDDKEFINMLKNIDENTNYLVISKIDEIDVNRQDKFYQIVKDREFMGYELSKNIVIALTVKNKDNLKNIKQELYHFCVVAF